MDDSITREQVTAAYQKAPEFVRIAFNDPKTTELIMSFKGKYNLHIDQLGTIGREVGYLLLGLTNPEKFATRLKIANFSQDQIVEISKELNEKIFSPIHSSEIHSAAPTARPATPVQPARPKVVVFNQPSQAKPAAPAPAHIAPLPPKTVMPTTGSTLHDAVQRALASKPAAGQLMLEDHEEPHIDVPSAAPKAQSPIMQTQSPIAPKAETRPASSAPAPTFAPKPPMPPAPPAPAAPLPPRQEPPATPGIPQVTKTPPPPPITSYSVDPYREPIDEES